MARNRRRAPIEKRRQLNHVATVEAAIAQGARLDVLEQVKAARNLSVYGGTMTMIAASMGTPFAFDPPDGCVLFFEDINERPYKVERLLTQFAQAGVLDRATAIVFGEMKGCQEGEGGMTARFVAEQLAGEFDGPILYGFPSGHTTGPCWTLPLGVRVTVRAGAAVTPSGAWKTIVAWSPERSGISSDSRS